MRFVRCFRSWVVFSLAGSICPASDLAFSDPAKTPPPPAGAIGFPNRAVNFEVWPGFQQPPPGYGTVPFYWWLGDPLTPERLGWQLEQMRGMGVSGYQINYAHSDKGGRSFGLTLPSEPPLFSERWWELTGWFMREAKRHGAGISLSDYTLGFGQGWHVDELLREHPEVIGMRLRMDQAGKVTAENVPWSINPMHPMAGKWYAEKFFGQFERRFPGEGGQGLNFFFSDELGFGVSGRLWSAQFAAEFQRRKGYDLQPELAALFKDIGPRTPKVRLDYSDVLVALSEEGFFKPIFDWHQQRGMIMGCDHGGRGRNVVEFGDYFRTQRWNQGPGADQPALGKNLIKAKVAASIAHLYERPRVWLEGFYGSGWGTTSAGFVDATFANFVMGFDLLGIHGMYYSTHGGWWEWAPPDNTFRMPYWPHLRGFMECVQRLSFLLSHGHHRCDVAILYPVAPMEAGLDGAEAVKTAFATAEQLYAQGVDFDFMDFESLARAQVVGRELHVSGEVYRVLVLPAMKAARHSTLEKAREFHRAGGIVVALGALPEASDRVGRDDPEVAAIVREIFPDGPTPDLFARLPDRDYTGPGFVQHRKIGAIDLYAIYGAPRDTECVFRATGQVELWDPWTGTARPLAVTAQTTAGTRLRLPLTEREIQLIVFRPGTAALRATSEAPRPRSEISLAGDWEFELQPTLDNRFGDFHWPPTPARIGAEIRQLWYCEGEKPDGPWRRVTCGFGPQFIRSSSLPAAADATPYEFSWRWGIEGDPGHQGYHGLKGQVNDEFLAIGRAKELARHRPEVVAYEAEGPETYFTTAILAPREMVAHAHLGPIAPAEIRLNGERVTGTVLPLRAGPNPLVLRYTKPGRTYFVASTQPAPAPTPSVPATAENKPVFQAGPLASRWWQNPDILPFDLRATEVAPVGWYRFEAPPGLLSFTVSARGRVQAWAGDQPLHGTATFSLPQPSAGSTLILLRIEQERSCYGGAALPEPIRLDCGPGRIALGDWSKQEGLNTYSGGAWYRKSFPLTAEQAQGRTVLDLGNVVASAEVRVNGHPAGVRLAPPWTLDISRYVRAGDNRLEVLVCNTLANHYVTIPTRYRGELTSGLLGPVTLQVSSLSGDR
ncbi:MAG: hypothetical protein HZC55_18540 [Verrucomicrobia bacterium]|nr:hypothetical protein [Verrucomicrobiota bacterium]